MLGIVRVSLLRSFVRAAVASVLALSVATFGSYLTADVFSGSTARGADGGAGLGRTAAPVRIEVPTLGIDLPVISSKRNVKGNPAGYPLCDVAQYWTRYDLPGAPGTAWIFAHAQPGMFLPLLTKWQSSGERGLLGTKVKLQLADGRLLTYRIDEVRRRATTNLRIGDIGRPNDHRLILQTSTGPTASDPKLQAAARLVRAERTERAAPKAKPRACSQPATGNGERPGNGGSPSNETEAPTEEPTEDTLTMLVGTGAVLLGATLLAVFLVRRQP